MQSVFVYVDYRDDNAFRHLKREIHLANIRNNNGITNYYDLTVHVLKNVLHVLRDFLLCAPEDSLSTECTVGNSDENCNTRPSLCHEGSSFPVIQLKQFKLII